LLFLCSSCLIIAQPVANFSSNSVSGCNPLKVDFINKSQKANSFLWKLGNGNESTLENPSAVYNISGKYTITLIATDNSGNSDTFVRTDYITVFESPQALFKKSRSIICTGDTLSFNDNSIEGDASIISWKWDFGDGGTSTNTNPEYKYTLPGKYDVTLAVADANGCQSTLKSVKYVDIIPLPQIIISSNDKNKCQAPATVNFTGSASGKTPLQYAWDFGDGGTSTQANPAHQFNNLGKYNISLAVKDANGCMDSVTMPSFVSLNKPAPDFVANRVTICPGVSFGFKNLCTPIDSTAKFYWEFGDGLTSTDSNPVIQYKNAGIYSVRLVYTWDGCTVDRLRTNYITVYKSPKVQIQPHRVEFCRSDKDSIEFTNSGSDYVELNWFTNGNPVGRSKPGEKFKFPAPANGKYFFYAFPLSANGCSGPADTANVIITGPKAEITANPKDGCIPFSGTATYKGSGTHPIVNYNWSGLSGTSSDSSYNYNKTTFGKTKFILEVTDSKGCKDTATVEIDGGIKIDPVFSVPSKVCRNEKFWVYNHSDIRNPDTVQFKYTWKGNSPQDLEIIDSIKRVLRDTPNTEGVWGFEAHSHGCITYGTQRPKTKILGPKLDGVVKTICNSDSLHGNNKSSDYTSTYWRYLDKGNNLMFNTDKYLDRALSETKELWLFTFNDTNKCSDSLPYDTKVNPQSIQFTWNYNCDTRELSAQHTYKGLTDTSFQWILTNQSSGIVKTIQSRKLKTEVEDGGNYKLDIKVLEENYGCTPSNTAYFKVNALPEGKPTVDIDRTNCYPIKLSLNDPTWNHWQKAEWMVGGNIIKDSLSQLKLNYHSHFDSLNIYLVREDSAGCGTMDTFRYVVHGFRTKIKSKTTGDICTESLIRFDGEILKKGAANYSYEWDMGYRISTGLFDTAIVKGSRKVTAKLTIRDDQGCESIDTLSVFAKNGKPVAAFTVSDTTAACPPLDVFFTDLSVSPEYPIVQRLWSFGDNTFSNKLQPGKLYIYPGKYSVKLIIANSAGCMDTAFIPNLVVINGPNGTYEFDKKEGCTPLELNLTTHLQGKIKNLEFDMGDGAVLDLDGKKHKYTRPGIYIPRLIIVDSNGCRFSPDPTDTIQVYANPDANFESKNVCDNQVYDIYQKSDMKGDSLSAMQWIVDGNSAGSLNPLTLGFKGVKNRNVELIVKSNHGCTDTTTGQFRVFTITPAMEPGKSEYCLGEDAIVKHTSVGDTFLASRQLWLDGILMPTGNEVLVPANRRGKIPAMLVVEDVLGCRDTAEFPIFIKVGDTLPTKPLTMLRTSVVNDFTTETKFNASIEPDFKAYKLYVWMQNSWQLRAYSENKNDTNLFVTQLNTLARSYCHRISQVNYCGMETDSTIIVPHCTVEVRAQGDSNAARVVWSPYSGWNVKKYHIWRKTDKENTFTLLDSVPGNITHYLDTAIYCHVIYDYRIEAFEQAGNLENSWSDTARAKPLHLIVVPAPEVWRTTVNDNLYTHTEWIAPRKPKFGIDYYTVYKYGNMGWETFKNHISADSFQINDFQTEVNRQYYTYSVQMTDKCGVKSELSNVGRSILLKIQEYTASGNAELTWTPYVYWNEGVQEYRIERSIGSSAFEQIGNVDGETLNYVDENLPKYCEKDFVYRVTAIRNQPLQKDSSHDAQSVSNYAEFAPPMRFFIPNAYTPNRNNLNETFHPDGIYFYKYDMKIYNRYGQKVYDRDECLNAWNGTYNGEIAQDGVYAYYIKAWDMKGKEFTFSGTIHLLR